MPRVTRSVARVTDRSCGGIRASPNVRCRGSGPRVVAALQVTSTNVGTAAARRPARGSCGPSAGSRRPGRWSGSAGRRCRSRPARRTAGGGGRRRRAWRDRRRGDRAGRSRTPGPGRLRPSSPSAARAAARRPRGARPGRGATRPRHVSASVRLDADRSAAAGLVPMVVLAAVLGAAAVPSPSAAAVPPRRRRGRRMSRAPRTTPRERPGGTTGRPAGQHPQVPAGHDLEAHVVGVAEQVDQGAHGGERGDAVVSAREGEQRNGEVQRHLPARPMVTVPVASWLPGSSRWYSCP